MSPRYRLVRWFVATAAVVTLLSAIVLTVPPLRALAQDILRQIGIMTVTDGPTPYERAQRPIPALDLARASGEWEIVSAEEIESNVNWRAVFDTVPAGFERLEYGRMTDYDLMMGFFGFRLYRSGETEPAVSLKEQYRMLPHGPIEYETGGAQTETVDINGTPGKWVSGFSEHPELDMNMLIWEVDWDRMDGTELILILEGHDATKEELLEIAHAMTIRTIESIPVAQGGPFVPHRTPKQIATQVGFDVAVLPTRTYHPPQIMNIYQGEDFTQIDSSTSSLVLQQVKVHDASRVQDGIWRYDVGETPVEDVVVNGNPGVWIEGLPSFLDTTRNILLWEQDGFSFSLSSMNVSKEGMIEAAESIEFVGPDSQPPTPRRFTDETPEAVAAEIGFAVAVPGYLPEGYVMSQRRFSPGPMLTELATSYDRPPAQPGQPFAFLTFRQAKPTNPADAGQQLMTVPIGDAATEDVTVNGQPGIFVEQWQMSADFSQRLLIWEQEGFSLAIAGTLPRDEMFRIAESVELVGPAD